MFRNQQIAKQNCICPAYLLNRIVQPLLMTGVSTGDLFVQSLGYQMFCHPQTMMDLYLVTWVLFWLASLLATPRAWENVMPPRR